MKKKLKKKLKRMQTELDALNVTRRRKLEIQPWNRGKVPGAPGQNN